jgi:hypothetical protein
MKSIVELFGLGMWLAGIVLAVGAMPTAIAVIFPLYAWYLVMERVLILAGIVV